MGLILPVMVPPTMAKARVTPKAASCAIACWNGVYSDPGSSDSEGKYMVNLKRKQKYHFFLWINLFL